MPASAGLVQKNQGKTARSGGLERLTVNLTPRAVTALELATELTGDSKTDVVNTAVQVYAYLELVLSKGGTVQTQESEGSTPKELKFF